MKLVICTKFHVNRMNCVESRRAGVPIDPPPLKASCSYFFLKASRVKDGGTSRAFARMPTHAQIVIGFAD